MPTDGYSHSFNVEAGIPATDLEYWKATYKGQYFLNFMPEIALRFHGRFGYGDGYGELEDLPFFEYFYAGGFGSVRGFERSSLGPKGTPSQGYLTGTGSDPNGNLIAGYAYDAVSGKFVTTQLTNQDTIGGNILVESGVELIFPLWFIKERRSLRTVLFVDAGNVFDSDCGDLQETCYDIQVAQLRASYGFGLTWVSALGPLSFSIAQPFNETSTDDTKFFQFTIGTGF
jgi:outer membrane protein insertion porin family